MHRLNLNHEEVNSIAVNVKGTMLAAADDAGQVAVVDLATHSLMRMPRSGHANVASSVTFRDHRLWEVVSGGLDAVAVLWDFASGRQLKRWEFGVLMFLLLLCQQVLGTIGHRLTGMAYAGREGGGENQMFNPPLVHCVATPHNAEHPFTRLVATARGDGAIAVFDADADANKSRKQNSAGLSTRPTVCNLSHAAAANHVYVSPPKCRFVTGRTIIVQWTPICAAAGPFRRLQVAGWRSQAAMMAASYCKTGQQLQSRRHKAVAA